MAPAEVANDAKRLASTAGAGMASAVVAHSLVVIVSPIATV